MNYFQSGSSPLNDGGSGWDLKLVPPWLSWGSPAGVAVHLDHFLPDQMWVAVDYDQNLCSTVGQGDLDLVLRGRVDIGVFVLAEDE